MPVIPENGYQKQASPLFTFDDIAPVQPQSGGSLEIAFDLPEPPKPRKSIALMHLIWLLPLTMMSSAAVSWWVASHSVPAPAVAGAEPDTQAAAMPALIDQLKGLLHQLNEKMAGTTNAESLDTSPVAIVEKQETAPVTVNNQVETQALLEDRWYTSNKVSGSDQSAEELELVFRREAAVNNKLYILKFGADWCLPCKIMEKNTWQHPEVRSLLNKHFLTYAIDVEDFDGFELKSRYNIEAFPATLIFSSDGQLLGQEERSISVSEMLLWLQDIAVSQHRLAMK